LIPHIRHFKPRKFNHAFIINDNYRLRELFIYSLSCYNNALNFGGYFVVPLAPHTQVNGLPSDLDAATAQAFSAATFGGEFAVRAKVHFHFVEPNPHQHAPHAGTADVIRKEPLKRRLSVIKFTLSHIRTASVAESRT
jgi:hypothetical protein